MTINKTPNAAWPFNLDPVQEWAYWEKGFTAEECQKIIEIGNARLLEKGTTVGDGPRHDVRNCELTWLYSVDDLEWAFRRVTDIVLDLNNKFFKFELFGMCEGFQFTKYSAPGERYGAHVDKMLNGVVRKLSFTLQLSDPAEYEGGNLKIITSEDPIITSRERGYITVFPSYTLHEVTPVTKGTRYSLVSWITGSPFK